MEITKTASAKSQLRFGFHEVAVASILALAVSGCGRHRDVEAPSAPLSPEAQAVLGDLNHELRRTLLRHQAPASFAEFAASRPDVVVPAPPPGKKYAINKNWKVILVDDPGAKK